jgi:hypothetical protein
MVRYDVTWLQVDGTSRCIRCELYRLCSTFYGQSEIPLALQEAEISRLPPASSARLEVKFTLVRGTRWHRFDGMGLGDFLRIHAYAMAWKTLA